MRSNLKTIIQRVDEPLPEFAERNLRMAIQEWGWGGEWIQVLAVDDCLMGCTDKRSVRSALDRDPKTVGEAVSLMKRFHSHEKTLSVERRVRTRMGHVKCFSCGETGHIVRYCRSNVQRPYPRPRDGLYVKAAQVNKTLRAAGEQPVTVKLDKDSGGDMDDVVEMREITGNDRCNLVIDMTINNHCVKAVVDSGAHVSVRSRRFYDSLSCRPRLVGSIG